MKNGYKPVALLLLGINLSACMATTPAAVGAAPGANDAVPQLQHWRKMIGQWSTAEETLSVDGSGWQPGKGADWDFLWAFGGWGIQDNYTSPPLHEPLADEGTRQRGINLRIYNPKEGKWIMTWLTTASTKPQTFTARSSDEEIVMLAESKTPTGFYSRITFFDMQRTSFEWKLEYSKDQKKWNEVYRIHGTRKP